MIRLGLLAFLVLGCQTMVVADAGTSPPDAVNGVYTRWLYLPLLRGFAYLPSGSSNFWFLASE